MTNEEKARAYDEALKKLHEIITMDNNPVLPKEIGEFLFPQLTESDDERIRKMLIEKVEKWHEKALENNMIEDIKDSADIITYLEKQKETNIDRLHKISTPADENWFEIQKQWEKEDEDERIRHWLIGLISEDYKDENFPSGIKKTDVLNWLKKDSVVYEQGMYYYDGNKFLYCQQEKPKVATATLDSEKQNKSEDDIIRESLISLIETIGEYYISEETRNGYVAWLEKQKDLTTENIYKHSRERMSFWDGQQKEQKPTEFTHHEVDESLVEAVDHQMEDDGVVDDFVRRGLDDVVLKYAELGAKWQKEQKPAEIDEYKIIKKHITEDVLSSEVNKRLKECGWYVTDERPAEWSEEENEKQIRQIERIVKDAGCSAQLQERIHNWLKSLRSSWKPSREQMRELYYALTPGNAFNFDALKELYEQLKKLM